MKPFNVFETQQFDRAFLDELCTLTDYMRRLAVSKDGRLKLLGLHPDKRGMLYFTQPSTRTFLSFASACHILGMNVLEVRDPATSSAVKGETELDALMTFASYAHVIIMRSPNEGLAKGAASYMEARGGMVPIINAGSGQDQHPTQALLDVYTLARCFREIGGIDGKTIAMVGDLARGRTVRSISYLMRHYKDIHLIFVAPPAFKMKGDILEFLKRHEIPYEETEDFDAAVSRADAVYMTRIQDEHDKEKGASDKIDISRFSFTARHLKILGPRGVVLHPLPRRQELAPECDLDPRVKIWEQEENGMWTRAALLHLILKEKNPLE